MRGKLYRKFRRRNFGVNTKLAWWGVWLFLFIVILAGLGYLIYTRGIFKVKESGLQANIILSRRVKEKIVGKPLFSLNPKEISAAVFAEYPEHKRIRVFKKLPSSVIIEAEKRLAFAQLKRRGFYLIDKEAVVMDSSSLKPYPGFIAIELDDYSSALNKGHKIKDSRLVEAFRLIEALGSQGFSDEFEVELVNPTFPEALYAIAHHKLSKAFESSTEGIKIIFGTNDYRQKINILNRLVAQELKDKMPAVRYIDLRHKKTYVGFKR